MSVRHAVAAALLSGSTAYGATLPARSGGSGALDVPDGEGMPLGTAAFSMELQAQGSPGTRTSFVPSPISLALGLGDVEAALSLREAGLSGDARPGPLLVRPALKVHLLDAGTWTPAAALEAGVDRLNVAPGPQLRLALSTTAERRIRLVGFAGASASDLHGRTVRPEAGLALTLGLQHHMSVATEVVELRDGPLAGAAQRWSASELLTLSVGAHYMPDARAWVVSFGFGAATPTPEKKRAPEPEPMAAAETKKPAALGFLDDRPHFRLRIHQSGEWPKHLHEPGVASAPAKPEEKPRAVEPEKAAAPVESAKAKAAAAEKAAKPASPAKPEKRAPAKPQKVSTPKAPHKTIPPPIPEALAEPEPVELAVAPAAWTGTSAARRPSDYAVASPSIPAAIELPGPHGKSVLLEVVDAVLVQLPRKSSLLTPEQEDALEALMAKARTERRTVVVWGRQPGQKGRLLDAREQAARVASVLAWDADVNRASKIVVRTARVPGIDAPDVVVAVLKSGEQVPPLPAPRLPSIETPKPAPVETPKPAPVDEPKSAPAEAPKPAPLEEQKPAPVETPTSAPVEEPKPAPVEERKPAPVEEKKPAPVEEPKPAPVETPKPAPVEAPKPAPVEATKPAPVEEKKPAPVEPPKPAPVETPKPAPVEEKKPAPVEPAKAEPKREPEPSKPAPASAVPTLAAPAAINPMGLVPLDEPLPSAGPKGRVEEPTVERLKSGNAGREQLRDALMRHRPEIQRCVDHELKRSQLRKASGSVRITIDARGHVSSASLDGDKLSGSYLEKCVQAASRRWRFPASGDSYELEIPLQVSGKEDGP